LDESEREEFFRLKKVQDKKKKEKALKQEQEKAAGAQSMLFGNSLSKRILASWLLERFLMS
jgi:hypothetical protein